MGTSVSPCCSAMTTCSPMPDTEEEEGSALDFPEEYTRAQPTRRPDVFPAGGLHSFTSQLNLSALYGIGGARRGGVARVKGALGGVWGM